MRDLTRWLDDPATDAGINYYDGKQWTHHSYAEIADQVFGAAAVLRRHGIGRGDRVALILPSGPAFVRYFFATIAIGATPTPIAPRGYQGPMDYDVFVAGLLDTLRPTGVVSEGDVLDILAEVTGRAGGDAQGDADTGPVRVIDAGRPLPEGGDRSRVVLAKDELALIQFTSGSSSAPRGVTLTDGAVRAQVALLEEKYRLSADRAFGSWLPLHHDMGLIGLFLTPVTLGSELWLMRPEHFVRRPLEWLRIFGERGAAISAIPNFALERVLRRVRPEDLSGLDFAAWQALIVGSDRVSMPVLNAFHALLAPHGFRRDALSPSYGMAEATLAVSGTGHGQEAAALLLDRVEFSQGSPVRVAARRALGAVEPGDETLHSVVSCGSELVGVDIAVVGEDGHALPDGHVGELLVRSPALSGGYFGAPPEDARFTTGGYRTGDLGFRFDDQIYVLGRVGDSVKVNGRYVTAEDVELALIQALGIHHDKLAVALESTSGTPAVLVTVQRGATDLDPGRLGDVLASFGLRLDRAVVLHVGAVAVPRTTSGKPQRGKLWRSLVTGELSGHLLHLGEDFPHAFATDADTGRARIAPPAATEDEAREEDEEREDEEREDEERARLGGKGFHLTLMRREGMPVPPFAVLDAAELAGGRVDPDRLRAVLAEVAEAAAGTVADRASAVGLAVRSSPPRSMPGMMDTLLGIALSPADVEPLTRRLGDRAAAWEALLTQARHLCRHAAGADPARVRDAEGEPGDDPGARYDRLRELYAELTGDPYPEDPVDQVRVAVEAVHASWRSERARHYRRVHGIPEEPGPAVVVQAMTYGTAAGASGSGVVFSHNPVNGDPGLHGEYLAGSTGEALVSGTRTPHAVSALRAQDAAVHAELAELAERLHRRLRAMADIEFVVEGGRLWLVQVRPAAAAPHVLNHVALRLWRDGRLGHAEALARLDADALFAPLPPHVAGNPAKPVAEGLPACAGAARGPLVTRTEDMLHHPPGTAVLLRPTTEPSDFAAMTQAAAVVTLEGGGTSHAAVVARELNLPAVVGAHVVDERFAARLRAARSGAGGGAPLGEVTVCGTTGRVWDGRVPVAEAESPRDRSEELLAGASVTTALCLSPEAGTGDARVALRDEATGRPLALEAGAAEPPGGVAEAPPELRALRCSSLDELPTGGNDRLVATGDVETAERWAGRGGRVAFLHPEPEAERPWRTRLPDCPLAAVVLATPEQIEHARWTLAIRAARRAAR